MVAATGHTLVGPGYDPAAMQPINLVSKGSARAAYRVVPDPDDPVILVIHGNLCRVMDISASGLSFAAGEIAPGRRYTFALDLPTAKTEIRGTLDILPKAEQGSLHCKFVDLTAEHIDQLHRYVLIRQKEAIRSLRGRRTNR